MYLVIGDLVRGSQCGFICMRSSENLTYWEKVINVNRDLRFVHIGRGARRRAAAAAFMA